jgi:hypothetical protein
MKTTASVKTTAATEIATAMKASAPKAAAAKASAPLEVTTIKALD